MSDTPAWPGGGDMTRRVRELESASAKLREREEQLRLIVETALDYAIFMTGPDGVITNWLPGAEHVFGWSPEEAEGQHVAITFTPEDRAAGEHEKELETARREGKAPNVRWHLRKDGGRVFIEGQVIALPSADGEGGFLKIGQDVTERRRGEEHQRTLVAELQHRVRNTLAVVRSIARRTAERSADLEEMMAHFEGRLEAFSRVQAAVTRAPGSGIDLRTILEDEFLAVAAREGDQLKLSGPPVLLKARAAESLSLAAHELATNAVKYGALGSARGRVAVRWSRIKEGEREFLELEWAESGVDEPPEVRKEGFGMELLRKMLPYDLGAETAVDFGERGLRFRMRMPLDGKVIENEGGVEDVTE